MRYPSSSQPTREQNSVLVTTTDTLLGGAWLLMARVGWLAIVVPTVALYIVALPLRYKQLYAATHTNTMASALSLALEIFFMAAFIGVAAVLFWKRSQNWMALLSGLFLITFGVSFPTTLDLLAHRSIVIAVFTDVLGAVAYITLSGIGFFFPSGRCVPRWGWGFLFLSAILQIPFSVPTSSPLSSLQWPPLLLLGSVCMIFLPPIAAQLYRFRRVSNREQQQQTKWLVYGVSVALLLTLALRFVISTTSAYSRNSYFNANDGGNGRAHQQPPRRIVETVISTPPQTIWCWPRCSWWSYS